MIYIQWQMEGMWYEEEDLSYNPCLVSLPKRLIGIYTLNVRWKSQTNIKVEKIILTTVLSKLSLLGFLKTVVWFYHYKVVPSWYSFVDTTIYP